MIHYVTGDLFAQFLQNTIIVHVCNDVGKWGRGFTGAIDRNLGTGPRLAYLALPKHVLGETHFIRHDRCVVANMIAQRGVGTGVVRIQYEALATCLTSVASYLDEYDLQHVIMPRIGTGLAGGDWGQVLPIVEKTIGNYDVLVCSL